MLRFAGFELDRQRAELRKPDGEAIKLRPKTLAMLALFAANPGRVLSKQELMEAVWPNVHVGDDSLFQCIREIRTALARRPAPIVKLVSGHGYLFEAEVSTIPATPALAHRRVAPDADRSGEAGVTTAAAPPSATHRPGAGGRGGRHRHDRGAGHRGDHGRIGTPCRARDPLTVAVMPITGADGDSLTAAMAADVTTRLSDGLAKIDNVRVAAPSTRASKPVRRPARPGRISSSPANCGKRERSWEVRARMIRTTTGDIVWTTPVSVAIDDTDLTLQQSRLAASIGQPLALRIDALVNSDAKPNDNPTSSGSANVVDRAGHGLHHANDAGALSRRRRRCWRRLSLTTLTMSTSRSRLLRFSCAACRWSGTHRPRALPPKPSARDPRARPEAQAGLSSGARSLLPLPQRHQRVRRKPGGLRAGAELRSLERHRAVSYRVGSASVGTFRPGAGDVQAGRPFRHAAGLALDLETRCRMAYLVMDDNEDALPWLQRSIAITPATGRSYMLLSAAYQRLGQPEEARAAMEKAMTLRPGSNLGNVALPPKNASATFLAASDRIARAELAPAGLPEHWSLSVPIKSKRLWIFVLTRFLHANRCWLHSKRSDAGGVLKRPVRGRVLMLQYAPASDSRRSVLRSPVDRRSAKMTDALAGCAKIALQQRRRERWHPGSPTPLGGVSGQSRHDMDICDHGRLIDPHDPGSHRNCFARRGHP